MVHSITLFTCISLRISQFRGKIHVMKRDMYKRLLEWKSSPRRKPLLLQGARQTGKTFLLKEFGLNEYQNVVYCNFEEDPNLDQFFHRDLNPKRILADLSIYANQKIRPRSDLVIFDEIHAEGDVRAERA